MIFISVMVKAQQKITLSVNGKTALVTLSENAATQELLRLLPVTVEMSPYGGFEVVGSLPASLPTQDRQITTEPGDLMLYLGNQLVIFYGSNSWSYTPIGKIDGATAESVKDLLGTGVVTVTLSQDSNGVNDLSRDEPSGNQIYDLSGKRAGKGDITPGVYIVNGKKRVINPDR